MGWKDAFMSMVRNACVVPTLEDREKGARQLSISHVFLA